VSYALIVGATSYAVARWWAAGITVALCIAAISLLGAAPAARPAPGGKKTSRFLRPFLGADGRLSTSHTIALAWTAVVAYILLALIVADPKSWSDALKNLSPTYLLLWGFPYVALVLAKLTVPSRVASGSLVKPPSTEPATVSQLFSDDSGNTDVFDVQYVVFNVVAIVFVIVEFSRASLGSGFPVIPHGVLLLTGAPAAVYLINKVMPGGAPRIFSVSPTEVRIGQSFTIRGESLAPTSTTATSPTVSVGGVTAPTIATFTPTSIVVLAPDVGSDLGRPVDVGVTTGPGAETVVSSALKVFARVPILDGASTGVAQPGDAVTLRGDWSADEANALTVLVDTDVVGTASNQGQGTVTFKIPTLKNVTTTARSVPVKVKLREEASNAIVLLISEPPP
jgi:IPT/TIG domain